MNHPRIMRQKGEPEKLESGLENQEFYEKYGLYVTHD
jgi:hypothetical protein